MTHLDYWRGEWGGSLAGRRAPTGWAQGGADIPRKGMGTQQEDTGGFTGHWGGVTHLDSWRRTWGGKRGEWAPRGGAWGVQVSPEGRWAPTRRTRGGSRVTRGVRAVHFMCPHGAGTHPGWGVTHLEGRGGAGGEDEAGAVAEAHAGGQEVGLEVAGAAGGPRDADGPAPHQRVQHRRLPGVGQPWGGTGGGACWGHPHPRLGTPSPRPTPTHPSTHFLPGGRGQSTGPAPKSRPRPPKATPPLPRPLASPTPLCSTSW